MGFFPTHAMGCNQEVYGLVPKPLKRLLWIVCLGAMVPFFAQAPGSGPAPREDPVPALLEKARSLLGIPYRFGGITPKGFDCSGFVRFVFGTCGIDLDRTSRAQSRQGDPVDLDEIQPGDLLFFATRGVRRGVSHVGIYLGDGKFIHASAWTGPGMRCVKLGELTSQYFADRLVAARRILTGADEEPAPK
jgi:cell wall-associated NlpC family hydrolase